MDSTLEHHNNSDEQDIEILVDVLRQCFQSNKARYSIAAHQNALVIEIKGLQEYTQDNITEISEQVLSEFDPGFEEILLLPMKN